MQPAVGGESFDSTDVSPQEGWLNLTSAEIERVASVVWEALQRTPLLSKREREVLACLALDRSEKEIAAILKIAISTVGHHRDRGYVKVGVHNRVELLWRLLFPRLR